MKPRPDEAGADTLSGPAAEAAQAVRDGYLLTAALTQRVDLIRHLVDFSRQIIVLIGEEGSGKTALLHHLLTATAENWRVAKANADPLCNADALLKRLGAELGLNLPERDTVEARVTAFTHFLETARQSLLVPLVLIDDAHLLPADSLLLLLQLAAPESDAPHLRVALFCDSRMTRLLGSPQLATFKDSLTHTVEMPAFTLEDTAAYIALKWQPAEDDASPLLNEDYLREVHMAAGGIPGRLNALVRTSLEVPPANADGAVQTSSRPSWGYALAGVAAALTVAICIGWLRPFQRAVDAQPQSATESLAIDVTPPLATNPADFSTGSPPVAEAAPGSIPLPEPAGIAGSASLQAPSIDDSAINVRPQQSTSTSAVEPQPAPLAASHPALPELPLGPVVGAAEISPPPAAPSTADSGAAAARREEPLKPATASAAPAKPPAPQASGNWLQRQPQSNFVVQLFGSYQRASAERFIGANQLGSRAVVVPTLRDQKTWYVVVSGSYTNRTKAQTAIAELPEAVRRLNPWVRSVKDLRALAAADAG